MHPFFNHRAYRSTQTQQQLLACCWLLIHDVDGSLGFLEILLSLKNEKPNTSAKVPHLEGRSDNKVSDLIRVSIQRFDNRLGQNVIGFIFEYKGLLLPNECVYKTLQLIVIQNQDNLSTVVYKAKKQRGYPSVVAIVNDLAAAASILFKEVLKLFQATSVEIT